jgi:hypothetical protein
MMRLLFLSTALKQQGYMGGILRALQFAFRGIFVFNSHFQAVT